MSKKPSPNSLQGFIRTDRRGGKCTTMNEDTARAWFGLTDAQIKLARAGDTITLDNGSTVIWKP